MSLAKNMGKNLSNKYSQKFPHSAKKSKTDAIKDIYLQKKDNKLLMN